MNNNLTSEEIIKILNKYPDNLNLRDRDDSTLIFPAINRKNIKLVKYILSKSIDVDYYTIMNTYHPLKTAINSNFLQAADLIWEKIKDKFDYILTNRNLETIAHFLLKRTSTDKLALEILKECPSSVWASKDINKVTPLELLCNYEFKYNYLVKNKEVKVDFSIKNENWAKFLKSLPKYEEKNNAKLTEYPYTHSNLFQAKFKDTGYYLLYLGNKYKELYYPKLDDVQLTNLTDMDNMNMDWPDSLLDENNNIFPWIVCYENEDRYWVHPMLNNLINSQKNSKYRFGLCYLSLCTGDDGGLHANLLIYDFDKLTLERFDPYGNTVHYDKKLDNVLEEELTWNTGFKYIKTSDYMPVSGFQTVSDELNPYKQKYGDFGGYCLAWCIWYLEHRLINYKIESKDLVIKLIKKLSNNKISFMEYIRNYANNLNKVRTKYLTQAGLDSNTISNIEFTNNIEDKLEDFIINKFKSDLL